IVWLIHFGVMTYKRQRMAEKRGYIESTYIPPNRAGFGEKCICRKKLNPDGTITKQQISSSTLTE
ncbi:MAG: hypothetical protein WC071_13790, partial [Victivallaceae bacterium]